jgi:SagB-type dehydrogenase family enzyme
MSKALWVALPLLLLGALLLLQTWRRRPPSRQTLNAVSSLLLAAYLLATAGLGLFWVANQQLPVFDWHYLFGYATLLLVVLHLVLNLPGALRHLTRRGVAPTELPQARRRIAGAAALLLALGAAFWLGLRHGRSELRLDAAPAGGARPDDAARAALALVERFHAHTAHSRGGVLLRAPGTDWRDPPPRFKRVPQRPRIALPPPQAAGDGLAALGSALWHTVGVSDARGPVPLRASPSSGALFSTELYVASWRVAGLTAALWHHDARDHALERLADGAPDAAALGAPAEALDGSVAAIVATAVFGRTGHKYRDRAYRYVLADLGHALENLRVALGALGLQARFVKSFDEARVAATLGLDEAAEGVLALVAVSRAGQPQPDRPGAPLRGPDFAAVALPDGATPAELTAAIHRLSSLRAATAPLPAAPAPALPAGQPLTRATLPAQPPLAALAARRSVRRYAARPLPGPGLSALLAGLQIDQPLLSPALRLDLIAQAVDGLVPGAYRYDAARHALRPTRGPFGGRTASRAAGLDQDVIGDAAAVLVVSMDRAIAAADADGPARGYRHAFLEAGLIGERAYLGGAALGLGVCSVGAFYDDEIAALAGIDPREAWVLHLVAVGIPA